MIRSSLPVGSKPNSGMVDPKMATTGTLIATAMCIGAVSLDKITWHLEIKAADCRGEVLPAAIKGLLFILLAISRQSFSSSFPPMKMTFAPSFSIRDSATSPNLSGSHLLVFQTEPGATPTILSSLLTSQLLKSSSIYLKSSSDGKSPGKQSFSGGISFSKRERFLLASDWL